jgi:DNA-binding NarL/FixJ family response regulator
MKLLVVDDHLLFREGLRHILLRLDQTVDIHECGTVQEAVAVANHISEFDLVLLDMQLPGLQGLEGLLALKGAFPTSPITLISGVADQRAIAEGIRCGAQGFVSKSGSAEDMLNGLRKVINGEHHIPPKSAIRKAMASGFPLVHKPLSAAKLRTLLSHLLGNS